MKNKIITVLILYVTMVMITTNTCAEETNPDNKKKTVQQPYTTEVLIKNESADERKQGFSRALEELLLKTSDNPQILDSPVIKDALANSSIYVQRYTYSKRNVTPEQKSLFLQAQFNQSAINRLLQQAKSMEQATANKQILIWLVKTTTFGNKIIEYEGSNDIIVPILKQTAQNFGMSIIFPTLDLQDVNNIKANDICSLDSTIIKNASRRYGTTTIVAGCLQEPITSKMWTSQWLVLDNNQNTTFNFTGPTAADVINQAIRTMAPPPSIHPTKLTLRIINVHGLNQYNDIVRYLTTFKQITQVDLLKISAGVVELKINIIGRQQDLLDEINSQDKLTRNPDITTTPPDIDLDYKWLGSNNETPQPVVAKPVS